MAESALKRALASLYDCSSSLHWWLGFWTSLVVAGVALEIVFVVWEYVEDLHDCRRCLLHPPVRPNRVLFLLGLLGAALVAGGVAGELRAESNIATAETCIRKGNDTLFLLLSKEVGDAAKSAKIARDEADAATVASGKAQLKADAVGQQADRLKSELAEAESRTAKLEQRAEQLHKDIGDLEKDLSFRIFREQDKAAIALEKFAPVEVRIEYLPDWECRSTAGQIAWVVHEAHWEIKRENFVANPNAFGFFDGVGIAVNAAGNVPAATRRASDAADVLVAELNKSDIAANRRTMEPSFPLGLVVIRVGLRPNPAAKRLLQEINQTGKGGVAGNAFFP